MASLISSIVGVIVGVILFVAVAIPVSISVLGTVNWTGFATAQTVANLTPLALAVGVLVLVFGSLAGETGAI